MIHFRYTWEFLNYLSTTEYGTTIVRIKVGLLNDILRFDYALRIFFSLNKLLIWFNCLTTSYMYAPTKFYVLNIIHLQPPGGGGGGNLTLRLKTYPNEKPKKRSWRGKSSFYELMQSPPPLTPLKFRIYHSYIISVALLVVYSLSVYIFCLWVSYKAYCGTFAHHSPLQIF